MKKRRKNKILIGTIITAISLGTLLGIFTGGIFQFAGISSLKYILIPSFAVIIALISLKKPVAMELAAYAIAIILLSQAVWDFYAQDWNSLRTEIVIPAIISIVINLVSGRVKVLGAKKTLWGQLGLGK